MTSERTLVQQKMAALLSWEKSKRRESALVALLCYALIAALIALPLTGLLPVAVDPLWWPVLFSALLAPYMYFRHRWHPRESVRTIARLDKSLHLEERAITAWEIAEREEIKPPEFLVLKETGERLHALDPVALFERRVSWHAYFLAPLLLLWLGAQWFDIRIPFGGGEVRRPGAKTAAQKLGEFSRELQEKAKSAGLSESLKVGHEMEKVAQKGIADKTGDEAFKSDVAAMAKKIEEMGKPSPTGADFLAGETQAGLRDLKTELEVFKDHLSFPEALQGGRGLGEKMLENLGALPRLKRELDRELPSGDKLSEREMRAFLDRLERDVTREQDRRTLLEAQQFLESLMREGEGKGGEGKIRVAGRGEQKVPAESDNEKNATSLPGDESGSKGGPRQPLPPFGAGASAHLKGLLGEGKSGGLVLRGKPNPGESRVAQEEVVASYRRQAEEELNSERIPSELKEAIKNYFLSLGLGEGRP